MSICTRCKEFGLLFDREYSPSEFFASSPQCETWIIGLNPKDEGQGEDKSSLDELNKYFSSEKIHSYFNDFKKVSVSLYNGMMSGKVAHTDIVKCLSKKWPPENYSTSSVKNIVDNCSSYMEEQIRKYEPKMLICNGSVVCRAIRSIVSPSADYDDQTHYLGSVGKKDIHVVLSGFIGRIDDYAKRRLGKEIEFVAGEIGIQW